MPGMQLKRALTLVWARAMLADASSRTVDRIVEDFMAILLR